MEHPARSRLGPEPLNRQYPAEIRPIALRLAERAFDEMHTLPEDRLIGLVHQRGFAHRGADPPLAAPARHATPSRFCNVRFGTHRRSSRPREIVTAP
jgi:hypothetical protein